jgi:hypothetical protein
MNVCIRQDRRTQYQYGCSHSLFTLEKKSLLMKPISSSDIVIGKILPNVGWFGKLELEGMEVPKPVISYVSDELYDSTNLQFIGQ